MLFKLAQIRYTVRTMFCDQTQITVQAGKGGDGLVSFRRAKYMPKGGPNGGDGGRGGDVRIVASQHLNSLVDLHTRKFFKAASGERGGTSHCHGKNSEDLLIEVPVGTKIVDGDTGELLSDLTIHGDTLVAVVGGRGGYGNAHFTTSVRQAPNFAELGEPGGKRALKLELQLVADIGLIGLPNAGKSTFLATTSSARPKIGNFPFTTIIPNLGVIKLGAARSLVACDLPGLIAGAAAGKGLGHQFLRHVSRNRVLVHLLDVDGQDLVKNYTTVRDEIAAYSDELAAKPELICFSKIDLLAGDDGLATTIIDDFCAQTGVAREQIFIISSATGEGTKAVLEQCWSLVEADKAATLSEPTDTEHRLFQPHLQVNPKAWRIERLDENEWRVRGQRIEQIVTMTDLTSPEATLRIDDVLRKMGIEQELLKLGAERDDMLIFGESRYPFDPKLENMAKR